MAAKYSVTGYTGHDRTYGQSHEVHFTRRFTALDNAERFARHTLTLPAVVMADITQQGNIVKTVKR